MQKACELKNVTLQLNDLSFHRQQLLHVWWFLLTCCLRQELNIATHKILVTSCGIFFAPHSMRPWHMPGACNTAQNEFSPRLRCHVIVARMCKSVFTAHWSRLIVCAGEMPHSCATAAVCATDENQSSAHAETPEILLATSERRQVKNRIVCATEVRFQMQHCQISHVLCCVCIFFVS